MAYHPGHRSAAGRLSARAVPQEPLRSPRPARKRTCFRIQSRQWLTLLGDEAQRRTIQPGSAHARCVVNCLDLPGDDRREHRVYQPPFMHIVIMRSVSHCFALCRPGDRRDGSPDRICDLRTVAGPLPPRIANDVRGRSDCRGLRSAQECNKLVGLPARCHINCHHPRDPVHLQRGLDQGACNLS